MPIKALAFDIFGTVVDWRSGVARAVADYLVATRQEGPEPTAIADAWRGAFQPRMQACRTGTRPFVGLDVLIAEALRDTLTAYGLRTEPAPLADLDRAWERLDPWPDVLPAFARLRGRFALVALSNGNVALTLAMARRAGLAWDAILGAEIAGVYKPLPEPYDQAVRLLRLAPHELCLVAAHEDDLATARDRGLATAYVDRPFEFGIEPGPGPSGKWDYRADDLGLLAAAILRDA